MKDCLSFSCSCAKVALTLRCKSSSTASARASCFSLRDSEDELTGKNVMVDKSQTLLTEVHFDEGLFMILRYLFHRIL